jgi:hypothetical protein
MPCIDINKRKTRDWINTNIVLRRNYPKYVADRVSDIIIDRNNGNHLSLETNGSPSTIFNQLVSIDGYNDAHMSRAVMFSDSMIGKTGNWQVDPKAITIKWRLPNINNVLPGSSIGMFANSTTSEFDFNESELNKENDDMLKCIVGARKGLRTKVKRGEMWSLVKDIKGPSHESGGVDIPVTTFNRNGKKIKAEEGLFVADMENLSATEMTSVDNITLDYADFLENEPVNNNTSVKAPPEEENGVSISTPGQTNEAVYNEYEQGQSQETPSSTSSRSASTQTSTPNYYTTDMKGDEQGYVGTCSTQHCSAYVQQVAYKNTFHNYENFADFRVKTGMYGDAWEVGSNILKAGGSRLTIEEAMPGDVVSINTKNSSYRNESFEDGSGNTHIAIVERVDDDGSVWVRHNAHKRNPNYVAGGSEPKFLGREYVEKIDSETLKIGDRESMVAGYVYRPNINNQD